MLRIEIDEEAHNSDEMCNILLEVIRLLNEGVKSAYEPSFEIKGEEEPHDEDRDF